MSNKIYALLVGIDAYPDRRHQLNGCVADVEEFAAFMKEIHCKEQLLLKFLTNTQATRGAIVEAIKDHLGRATSDDVVLFYFSGHGSQERAPRELWHLEPDRLNETFVCWDSRTPGGTDLADKELAFLIKEIADRGTHVLVILDRCHAGSGTRASSAGTAVRTVRPRTQMRSFDTYLFAEDLRPLNRSDVQSISGQAFECRHILIAACRDHELAKETQIAGTTHGVFSRYLLETLKETRGEISYRDLMSRTRALVSANVLEQSPQLEAFEGASASERFLGGHIQSEERKLTVSFYRNHGCWGVDAGAAHGIMRFSRGETTTFSLFSVADNSDGEGQEWSGAAHVRQVHPSWSEVKLELGRKPARVETFVASLASLPIPKLKVHISGEPIGVSLVRDALPNSDNSTDRESFIQECTKGDSVDFRLVAQGENYTITRPHDDRPLVEVISGLSVESARLALNRLEHIARWKMSVELKNNHSSIAYSDVELKVEREGDDVGTDVVLRSSSTATEKRRPRIRINVANHSERILYVTLYLLTDQFEIALIPFSTAKCERLKPGHSATANALKGGWIYFDVPDELWARGVTESHDIFKLVVSTDELMNPELLQQEELDAPRSARNVVKPVNALERLMSRVQGRAAYLDPADVPIGDWVTREIVVTTDRPQENKQIHTANSTATVLDLGYGVTVWQHSELRANVRVLSASEATRDLGDLTVPPILRGPHHESSPLHITGCRGQDSGLTALEFSDIIDCRAVSPEHPLRVDFDNILADDELLLAYAFDGEWYLPVGKVARDGNKASLAIERLPEPTAHGRRSLTGATKILLHKLVGRRLGLNYNYPRLGMVAPTAHTGDNRVFDVDTMKKACDQASRIAIVIHGIIGDTDTILSNMGSLEASESEGAGWLDAFDVVLTFDYESVNTSIEETARQLKEKLKSVGMASGHEKMLHVVAHSMGGLVARWFIERENGDQVVTRLTMFGTPNGGSPWPTIQNWATTAITFGLNGLASTIWPANALAGLAGLLEGVDVALDQMEPASDLLRSLSETSEPQVAYDLVAGNTSLIEGAIAEGDTSASLVSRLLQRLYSVNILHRIADPAFLGAPNDIAVSVQCMEQFPVAWAHRVKISHVPCDHLSYFRDRNAYLQFVSRPEE